MTRLRSILASALALAALLGVAPAVADGAGAQQPAADRDAIRAASLDYIEGFYEGDTVKLTRSIRPQVYKFGFGREEKERRYGPGEQMTWQQILDYAGRVRASTRKTPATAPKGVALLDVLDQTAAAKVTAWWGTDYLLLGKFDGRWMITHVLWQSPTPRA
jgi:hypothetical protein